MKLRWKTNVSEISVVASGEQAFLYDLEYLSMPVSVANPGDQQLILIGFYFWLISFSKITIHTCMHFETYKQIFRVTN